MHAHECLISMGSFGVPAENTNMSSPKLLLKPGCFFTQHMEEQTIHRRRTSES